MENKRCLNCDTQLEGRFCYHCGQKHINPNVTVKQLLNQFMEEFFTFDNRFYNTLKPLLFSPGQVTMDYNSGKRARYMPLLKLYLFVSFALFLLMPYGTAVRINVNNTTVAAQPPLEKTAAQPLLEKNATQPSSDNEVEPEKFEPVKQEQKAESNPEPVSKIESFVKGLLDKITKSDPQVMRKEIISHFPHMMFLLMPFFALLLKLFYRRSDSLYTHHLVFSVHFHTFVFLLLLVLILTQIIGIKLLEAAAGLLFFYVPWYLYKGLKRISGQSGRRTVAKTTAILFIYWLVSMICMAILILLTIILS